MDFLLLKFLEEINRVSTYPMGTVKPTIDVMIIGKDPNDFMLVTNKRFV